MRFVVETRPGMSGARLSRLGHWGNVPFADVAAAQAEARRIGGGSAIIEHERARAVRPVETEDGKCGS